MEVLKPVARSLLALVGWLPGDVVPGAFAGILLLLTWVMMRGRRAVFTRVVRAAAVAADGVVGVLLLPEYTLTTQRRRQGLEPSPAVLLSGSLAERVLDRAAQLYSRHEPAAWAGHPPWGGIVALVLASYGLALVARHGPIELAPYAATFWQWWAGFQGWAAV